MDATDIVDSNEENDQKPQAAAEPVRDCIRPTES